MTNGDILFPYRTTNGNTNRLTSSTDTHTMTYLPVACIVGILLAIYLIYLCAHREKREDPYLREPTTRPGGTNPLGLISNEEFEALTHDHPTLRAAEEDLRNRLTQSIRDLEKAVWESTRAESSPAADDEEGERKGVALAQCRKEHDYLQRLHTGVISEDDVYSSLCLASRVSKITHSRPSDSKSIDAVFIGSSYQKGTR